MGLLLEPDKAKNVFDDATLDRIINTVGVPFNGQRDALRHDLLVCYSRYALASGPGSSGFNKRQIDRLNSVSAHAKRLVKLLKEEEDDLGVISCEWPKKAGCPAYPLMPLSFLISLIDSMPGLKVRPGDLAKGAKKRLKMSGSALEDLISTSLREVYENNFEAKPGRSRTAEGDPAGPYFRFVRGTLAEFRVHCSDETIIRYIGKS